MSVSPIPEGYHTVTPYMIINGAAKALEFYRQAFGATELFRLAGPDDSIGHAEIKIGDSHIMLADECEAMGFTAPKAGGGAGVSICLYVENVDELFEQAKSAGATVLREVADQFYGDRTGTLADPFNHVWTIATHIEDVPPEELQRRMAAMGDEPGNEE